MQCMTHLVTLGIFFWTASTWCYIQWYVGYLDLMLDVSFNRFLHKSNQLVIPLLLWSVNRFVPSQLQINETSIRMLILFTVSALLFTGLLCAMTGTSIPGHNYYTKPSPVTFPMSKPSHQGSEFLHGVWLSSLLIPPYSFPSLLPAYFPLNPAIHTGGVLYSLLAGSGAGPR